jgi:hypothetical protein
MAGLALAIAAVGTVHAKQSVIFQQSSKTLRSVSVFKGLLPKHSYRVNISSPLKQSYTVVGSESYLYVKSGALRSGSKGVSKSGKTPASFVLQQPYSGDLRQWLLTISVGVARGKGITVRVTDLGAK